MSWRPEGWKNPHGDLYSAFKNHPALEFEAGADAGIKALVEWLDAFSYPMYPEGKAGLAEYITEWGIPYRRWQQLREEVGL